jgi:hypothetical protein
MGSDGDPYAAGEDAEFMTTRFYAQKAEAASKLARMGRRRVEKTYSIRRGLQEVDNPKGRQWSKLGELTAQHAQRH